MTQQVPIRTLEQGTTIFQNREIPQWTVNGEWLSFIGKWNQDWKIGGIAKGVFTTKTGRNGQTYKTIGCPPELKQQGGFSGNTNPIQSAHIENISKQLTNIGISLQAIATYLFQKNSGVIEKVVPEPLKEIVPPIPSTVSPLPPEPVVTATNEPESPSEEPQINVDDIPF